MRLFNFELYALFWRCCVPSSQTTHDESASYQSHSLPPHYSSIPHLSYCLWGDHSCLVGGSHPLSSCSSALSGPEQARSFPLPPKIEPPFQAKLTPPPPPSCPCFLGPRAPGPHLCRLLDPSFGPSLENRSLDLSHFGWLCPMIFASLFSTF